MKKETASMEKAPLGKRFLALLIDSLIIGFAAFLVSLILGDIFIVSSLIAMIYSTLMEGSAPYATVGKRVMKLRVVDSNGNGADMKRAAIRNLVKFGPALLGLFLPYIPGLFGLINYGFGVFGAQKQAIHDMAASTFVVPADAPYAPPVYAAQSAKPPASPVYAAPAVPPVSAPGVFVRGLTGIYAGARFQVVSPVVFGRDQASCQIVFPADEPGVSGRHCEVSVRDGYVFLTDLDSSYGTFAAGARLESGRPTALRHGDSFTVGSNTFTIEIV